MRVRVAVLGFSGADSVSPDVPDISVSVSVSVRIRVRVKSTVEMSVVI